LASTVAAAHNFFAGKTISITSKVTKAKRIGNFADANAQTEYTRETRPLRDDSNSRHIVVNPFGSLTNFELACPALKKK
jgi:hypothetical protein